MFQYLCTILYVHLRNSMEVKSMSGWKILVRPRPPPVVEGYDKQVRKGLVWQANPFTQRNTCGNVVCMKPHL